MRIFRLLGIYLMLVLPVTASIAAEDTQYFAVFMEGSKIGYAVHTRIAADGQVITTETVNMTISRLNIPITVNTTETNIETTDGKPLAFSTVEDLSGMSMNVKGTVDDQGVIQITNSQMSGQQKSTLQWTTDAVMAEGLRLMELKKGLKEGLTYKAKIFSPSMLQALDVNITIGPKQKVDLLGRVVELTQVQTAVKMDGTGEVATFTYVDKNLEMLKSVTPMMGMQIELVACEKEFAMADSGTFELADKMFLDSPIPLDNISSIPAISYHLTPIKNANGTGDTSAAKNYGSPLNIPSSDNQMVRLLDDGSVLVAVRPAIPQKGAKFPY
ncbi:MAG: hypothetical protein NTW55_03485, partial [Planctomycetota bacterium]|nr:hypothetical protein [Planctomycetota bacterium]